MIFIKFRLKMFGNDSLSKKVIDAKHGNVKIQWIIDY